MDLGTLERGLKRGEYATLGALLRCLTWLRALWHAAAQGVLLAWLMHAAPDREVCGADLHLAGRLAPLH
jgi:hypothetical protein